VAVKTGTSRAYVDNWTLGFTKERTVGVWVGNFDGTPMKGVSGITGAGPLFKKVMTRAMAGISPAPLVDRSRFERADICALSGQLAGPACPGVMHEVFLPGTRPTDRCAMHRLAPVDARTGAPARCGDPRARLRPVTDVGPAYYAWARGEGLDAGPAGGCVEPAAPRGEARLLLPTDGDEYMLEPGIPAEDQTIPVRALAPEGVARLEVRTDDGAVRPLTAPFSTRVPARPGRHRVELWVPGSREPVAVAWYRVR
jgi:penicillin-binding protein 1C